MANQANITYKILSLEGIIKDSKTIRLKISPSTNSMYIIHQTLVKQLNDKRYGNANCKNRGEVKGSGKKPWKQKGTGRARVGSIRSPLWKGGGVIFGPKNKEYKQKINKKELKLALRNMLYNKQLSTIIIENFSLGLDKPSTKEILQKLRALNIDLTNSTLIIVANKDYHTYLSIRNIKNINLVTASQINMLSIMNAKNIIIEAKALDIITEAYNV